MFEPEGRNNKIVLRGNSSLALAKAFNWYLNKFNVYIEEKKEINNKIFKYTPDESFAIHHPSIS